MPCGADLEDTQELAAFDAYRIFGNDIPLADKADWREIREKALEALSKSKDFRLLAHLAAATLRTEGLSSFFSILSLAERWLNDSWDNVYPRIDDDALLRKNALNGFADRMAIVDALRRAPIVSHRQLGAFSLRHVDIASGRQAPGEGDSNAPSTAQISATLEGTPVEDLAGLSAQVTAAISAVRNIVSTMQTKAGFESSPDFDPLLSQLSHLHKLLREHLDTRMDGQATSETAGETDPAGQVTPVGSIKTRQDAVRALEAAAAFFRRNEPSSPVPLLLDRAKRLVSKSFLEVLEDIAPDSMTQAKLIGGIKGEEG
jgi:type VI secretion system protein ImpA